MKRRFLSTIDVQVNEDSLVIGGNRITLSNVIFIKEMLPRGANGLVFKATDTLLKRRVAVKIWIPNPGDLRNRTVQALAEASKIAQLNHKNIVQIHQCSQLPNGWIYSVMEYVDGMNLDTFMTVVRPDFFQRFRLWKQIEEALNYSHSLGVFHGDLHAGNILIVEETIKVIDFGTSIFALNKTDSQKRETEMLISLNRRMFSTYKPSRNKIIDVDLPSLNPVRALSALSTCVDILFEWQQMFSVTRSEDWLITEMHHFAFAVMRVPVFSIEHLVQQLARKKVSINVQNHFVASCLIWADVFLKEPVIRGPHGLPYWDYNMDLDPQVNKARLKEITPSLRDAFYKNGPLQ